MQYLVTTGAAIWESDLVSSSNSAPFGFGYGSAATGGAGGVVLYWRTPEEWAEVVYDWVCGSIFLFITDGRETPGLGGSEARH